MPNNKFHRETANNGEDLCVFGYEVKFFNKSDISKQDGPYMIRLPYEDEIEVDRYDCRLLLHSSTDIGKLQPKDDEPDFEEEYLCDEERYLDLKALALEEKKPSPPRPAMNAAIPYTYSKQSPSPPNADSNQISEEPFVPPKHQYYPSGMNLPKTKKQALLIEKIATFVVEKGSEYEAGITSKASSNKSLSFLLSDDLLNNYYKYVMTLIKDKIYIAIPLHQEPEEETKKEDSDSDDEYLSPLLLRKRKLQAPAAAPPPVKQVRKLSAPVSEKPKDNEITEPKVYFEWYQRFYNGPSPYYPNILPKIIKPPEALATTIQSQAELIAKNGRDQEKAFAATDPTTTKHFHFTNLYYMFYQNHLFKRALAIEEAAKQEERKKNAHEDGEIVDDTLEEEVLSEEELKRQLERRQKAQLFLQTIFNQKQEKALETKKD